MSDEHGNGCAGLAGASQGAAAPTGDPLVSTQPHDVEHVSEPDPDEVWSMPVDPLLVLPSDLERESRAFAAAPIHETTSSAGDQARHGDRPA